MILTIVFKIDNFWLSLIDTNNSVRFVNTSDFFNN